MSKKKTRPAETSRRGGSGTGVPRPTDSSGRLSVLIEFRHLPGASGAHAMGMARSVTPAAFTLDEEFEPVSLRAAPGGPAEFAQASHGLAATAETYVVRGTVANEKDIDKVRANPDVAEVWIDTPIAPFPAGLREPQVNPQPNPAAAACPIPPCDCDPGTPKGTIADVATYLGVNQVWTAGFRGNGIVVGVVDSGITAQGRPVKSGETPRRIARVIGGWPTADWGTESGQWGDHGNMCATDVLGMAPDAQLYDLRVAGPGGSPGTISRALQAFTWAIGQHRLNGTPHILTNSWGIFQENWDATYARNPAHPFTRKVVEAINEGILVLFAAGNCGDTCPDGRCGPDIGPNRSIWGANGHPLVMTVGAVNRLEQFVGYSSRGPAALDPNKPDFCSITHFTGYNTSDSGTSAATPILAGAVALLKQAKPAATQDEIKQALKATAKDIGPAGFDTHSGSGIVQIRAAFTRLTQRPTLQPQCIVQTTPPLCTPLTQAPVCPPRTLPPQCLPQTLPPQCPPRTLPPQCVPLTIPPQCPPLTQSPACPPRTLPPQCVPLTIPPQCPPLTQSPACPPRTLPPQCLPQTQPPGCLPRTLPPQCPRPTLPPGCLPATAPPQCLPVTLGCPRPTLGCFAGPQAYGYSPQAFDPVAAYYAAAYGYGMYDPSAGYYPAADPGAGYYDPNQGGWDPSSVYGYPAVGNDPSPQQSHDAVGMGEYVSYPGEQWTGGGGQEG